MVSSQLPFVFGDDDIERIVLCRDSGQKRDIWDRKPFYIVYIHKDRSKFGSLPKEIFLKFFFFFLILENFQGSGPQRRFGSGGQEAYQYYMGQFL